MSTAMAPNARKLRRMMAPLSAWRYHGRGCRSPRETNAVQRLPSNHHHRDALAPPAQFPRFRATPPSAPQRSIGRTIVQRHGTMQHHPDGVDRRGGTRARHARPVGGEPGAGVGLPQDRPVPGPQPGDDPAVGPAASSPMASVSDHRKPRSPGDGPPRGARTGVRRTPLVVVDNDQCQYPYGESGVEGVDHGGQVLAQVPGTIPAVQPRVRVPVADPVAEPVLHHPQRDTRCDPALRPDPPGQSGRVDVVVHRARPGSHRRPPASGARGRGGGRRRSGRSSRTPRCRAWSREGSRRRRRPPPGRAGADTPTGDGRRGAGRRPVGRRGAPAVGTGGRGVGPQRPLPGPGGAGAGSGRTAARRSRRRGPAVPPRAPGP